MTTPLLHLATLVIALAPTLACDASAGDGERSGSTARAAAIRAGGGLDTLGLDTLAAEIDLGHTLGDPGAPVAVVEFSDFGCPYCARFARTTLPTLRDEFVDAGLVRWRYVPVMFGFAGGELMGAAATCAAELGGNEVFWQVHDLFYERQAALRGADARPRILGWLAELGLDRDQLDRCIDDPATRQTLEAHNRASQRWFVRGTPTFVVNGAPMSGALPLDFFRMVLSTALDPSGL